MPINIGGGPYDAPGTYDDAGAYDAGGVAHAVNVPSNRRRRHRPGVARFTQTRPHPQVPGTPNAAKFNIPGDITRHGDGVYSSGGSGDQQLVQSLRNLYIIARDHKRSRYDVWQRNYRLVNNRLGSPAGASNWMPAPRDSEIYPVLSSLAAWMTDQQVGVDFIPAVDPSDSMYNFARRLADDLTEIFTTTWQVEDYESDIKLALWDAFQYGTGMLKNIWDNSLSDGYGNAVLRRTDAYAFFVDPHATSMRDAEYMVEVRKMSYDELERRFPDNAERVLMSSAGSEQIDEKPNLFTETSQRPKSNPGQIPGSGTFSSPGADIIGRFSRPTSGSRFLDPTQTYVVYEFWLKENKVWEDDIPDLEDKPAYIDKVYQEEWRVVVMCNGVILLDENASDLWSHGQHPYERFVFDDIGEFYGISLVDHLAYPQIYINRLLTAMQYNAELVGNPILLEASASGTPRVPMANRPGQRITVTGPAGMQNAPEWLDPPQMPSQVMELIQFWINRIENTSGLSAMQKGNVPNQRSAEGVVRNVQEAAFVRVRSALHNLETCLRQCALKLADLIVDNYTEPRVMAVLGQEGQSTALALNERHFWVPGPDGSIPLKFQLRVDAGGQRPTSRQARLEEAVRFVALGIADDQYALEQAQVRNPEKILQRLYDKRQKGLIGAGPGQRQRQGRQQ